MAVNLLGRADPHRGPIGAIDREQIGPHDCPRMRQCLVANSQPVRSELADIGIGVDFVDDFATSDCGMIGPPVFDAGQPEGLAHGIGALFLRHSAMLVQIQPLGRNVCIAIFDEPSFLCDVMVDVQAISDAEASELSPNPLAGRFGAEFHDDEPAKRHAAVYQTVEIVVQCVLG